MAELLTIGLPSKGRIHDEALKWLGARGMGLERGAAARGYVASLKGMDGIEVRLMSASEIAGALDDGVLQLGVTGLDLLHERPGGLGGRIHVAQGLGFSAARVVVAVPDGWIDVETIEDLRDAAARFHERTRARLRVATKFKHMTRRFFAAHGISDYRIVQSLGATEGAPATGAADLIVDITETGATLSANDLKVLSDGIVLRSEAVLAASLTACWPSEGRALCRSFFERAQIAAFDAMAARLDGGLGAKP